MMADGCRTVPVPIPCNLLCYLRILRSPVKGDAIFTENKQEHSAILFSKLGIFVHKKADSKVAEDVAKGPDDDDEPKDQMTMTSPRTR
jgi:hypothetical protein